MISILTLISQKKLRQMLTYQDSNKNTFQDVAVKYHYDTLLKYVQYVIGFKVV